ncbi:hypothetical protein BGZ60DRAFT_426875 [Tricladium varicosporioides]|nr:hypothetical protein BGZ60DRAFT_426875 [Hymenoscyphus varicosporioides]
MPGIFTILLILLFLSSTSRKLDGDSIYREPSGPTMENFSSIAWIRVQQTCCSRLSRHGQSPVEPLVASEESDDYLAMRDLLTSTARDSRCALKYPEHETQKIGGTGKANSCLSRGFHHRCWGKELLSPFLRKSRRILAE